MKKDNISTNLIQVIKNLYNKATSAVFFSSSIADWFHPLHRPPFGVPPLGEEGSANILAQFSPLTD